MKRLITESATKIIVATVVVNSQEKADSILQERGRLWLAANKNE